MLKLIGAMFIMLSSTLGGYHLARRLSNRTNQIRDLLMSLQLLETEICYGATPLQSAFEKIGKQHSGFVSQLFGNCSHYFTSLDGASTIQCWSKALGDVKAQSALKKVEWEWLEHFGTVIGNSDRLDQQKHLNLMMTHLKKYEEEARDDQLKYEKMYRTLGFLAGAVIVILML
ncbi:stage III sporulation protein SpoIIIAB [Bacillus horti]|uniref:Stage III sporulation protein AB n=1 Tax=Caldalkalibacillus horti TaxID=77523 RepID=A0ABT9W104_9BACI|nr:stage III sporulation protein SpoIIIAB [Bacillus horti]MDQ0166886.1 stage III sporulation protein AB [Bacillus horti]